MTYSKYFFKRCENRECGKLFKANYPEQIYCCRKCGETERKRKREEREKREKEKKLARETSMKTALSESKRLGISYGQYQAMLYLEKQKREEQNNVQA